MIDSVEQRTWRAGTVLPLLFLAIAVGAGAYWVQEQEWPVEVVQIDGDVRYSDADQLQDIVSAYVRDGFFGTDLPALRDALTDMPWVRRATLRRIWPDTLTVDVQEHRAAARWNEDAWVSERGTVFPATDRGPSDLPRLVGPDGQAEIMLAAYHAYGRQLAAVDLGLVELRQDERRDWELVLASGPVIRLGREDQDRRLERFIAAWPAVLSAEQAAVGTVDLRYTNGFAVSWRDRSDTESPEGGA